ncbi:MAG: hypothetical protein L3J69_12530 [Desulfobacula sp.]|nr:hypothetical protein [Desulfobacula sp.]
MKIFCGKQTNFLITSAALLFLMKKRTALPTQPKWVVCQNNLTRSLYNKGDESATDFAYALALCRKGYTQTETYQKLLTERENWTNHNTPRKKASYLNRTITKVWGIVAQK